MLHNLIPHPNVRVGLGRALVPRLTRHHVTPVQQLLQHLQ
jgi:hypothetical protein